MFVSSRWPTAAAAAGNNATAIVVNAIVELAIVTRYFVHVLGQHCCRK
jgi:hypothetical protein